MPIWTLISALLAATASPSAAAPTPDPAAQARTIAAAVGGRVGFAAVHLSSGRTLGLNQNEGFPTQSVFKLPIAMAVLHEIDAGKLKLDKKVALTARDARAGAAGMLPVPSKHTVRELLEAMVIASDNVACDKLLALIRGPATVDSYVRSIGVQGMAIRYTELEMGAGKGDNTSTPAAMITLLTKLARRETGLSPASAKLLEDMLLRVTTGPNRLKAGVPPGTPVAHKTGTAQTKDGITDATNDVGLVTLPDGSRLAVAVFIQASRADEATREATIAKLAGLAYSAALLHVSP